MRQSGLQENGRVAVYGREKVGIFDLTSVSATK